jgi:hypothetical protein
MKHVLGLQEVERLICCFASVLFVIFYVPGLLFYIMSNVCYVPAMAELQART